MTSQDNAIAVLPSGFEAADEARGSMASCTASRVGAGEGRSKILTPVARLAPGVVVGVLTGVPVSAAVGMLVETMDGA